ncbi:hypothetical protein LIER_32521 [Lithospermum erythrorhizon]|uniref:Uncharacterized protein n=1 Tax=Lithospermum erythrorhizon TaxID=34254 RepID=A0AAV3RU16_LITER
MAGEVGCSRRRGGGDERFYCPPAMRERYNQQHLSTTAKANSKGKSKGSSASSASFTSSKNITNLDRFLDHTTPAVIAHKFLKTSMRQWKKGEDLSPYYILGDLWESFREWSAYGAGVPLVLNGSDSVIQYYVPYLSGIQLYMDPSKAPSGQRKVDDSDANSSRETSSNGSSEGIPNGQISNILGTERFENSRSAVIRGFNMLSPRNNHLVELSTDENEISNPPGRLVFEYMEHEPPYSREPLADKISALTSLYPEIKPLRSCDLTPASWMSVAWYPIYRIPTGPTLQNLDACFLTYHSLSTPSRSPSNDSSHNHASTISVGVHEISPSIKLSLPTFGLASYKLKVSVWDSDGVDESQKVNSLSQAADNWLRLLQVNHPDYTFFISREVYRR